MVPMTTGRLDMIPNPLSGGCVLGGGGESLGGTVLGESSGCIILGESSGGPLVCALPIHMYVCMWFAMCV